MKTKKIKLALIGYGNVGKAFAKMLLLRRDYLINEYNCEAIITAISTKSKGTLIDENGIDTNLIEYGEFNKNIGAMQVIEKADYDVMVEITPINIMTGMPAIEHVKGSLNRSKHVITANKGTIAWAYKELNELAKTKNVKFYHEATVMDGIPIFNLSRETLKGCKITQVKGILNATTNYILDEMEKGIAYEDAVAEGKKRGFVEADPSMDVDGWDAAAKLTALMNVLMDADINPMDIHREGINKITKEMIDEAKCNNKKYKLLCHGFIENGKAVGTVSPHLIDKDNLFSSINGTAAAVTFTTDLMGDISVIEHVYVPEIDQTAYGILSDLIKILS